MANHRSSTRTDVEISEDPPSVRESETCPECGGNLVHRDKRAETVCAECGLVVHDEEIDTGPEWRAYTSDERDDKSRVGAPMTPMLHDKGLSTTISWQNKDSSGSPLTDRKRAQLHRLRRWNERFRSQTADDRNLKHALGEIDRMASALGLPDTVRETASVIYRRALEKGLLPGRSIEGMTTAALYAASRLDNVSRSIDEVTRVSRVDDMEIKRTYRYLCRELQLEVPPPDPTEYVGRFASQLTCDDATERLARELIDTAVTAGIHSGKDPVGIAASALYAAGQLSGESLSQREISEVATVSTVTIRKRYREILGVSEYDLQ